MAIVKPAEMDFSTKNIILILSGLPGTGKTTLALSAPDVLLIDADNGMSRVKPQHRKDASMCKTFEELKQDIATAKGQYKTIAIDTAGAFVDMLKDYVVAHPEEFPKGAKNSGGISLQGFGYVKQLFLDFSADLRKDFNVIYLFHEQMDKVDEGTFYSLVADGSCKVLVYQPADLAAHLFIRDGRRMLGFTPTEQYSAKSAYGIKGIVEIPELKDDEENNFLALLFNQIRQNLKQESAEQSKTDNAYAEVMKQGKDIIACVTRPEDVPGALNAFECYPNVSTSKKELKAMLKDKLTEIGITYDKKTKQYVWMNADAQQV